MSLCKFCVNILLLIFELQSDFSNKASETSERDYAIPTQCLQKAIDIGLDQNYVVPKVFYLVLHVKNVVLLYITCV